uniref:Polyadenylate-binding protein, cytoplasmic and nuclear n=1 Tax=Lygus hesperus TaxID=30085 RepID=A0A0A9ZBX8_LYGHE
MEAIMLLNNKVINGSTLFVAHHQPKAIREAQQLPVVRSHPPYPAAIPPIMYYQMPPMGTSPPQFAPYPPRRYMRPTTNKARANRTTKSRRQIQQLPPNQQSFSLAQTVKNIPTEEEKKQFLGETLFYKVQSLDAENAPKITGML